MISSVTIQIQKLGHGHALALPSQATPGSAGYDLYAALLEPIWLKAKGRLLVPTGIAVAIPMGFEAQIRPRSGLALKHGITVLNAPGTIDSDYRGEVKVILIHHGDEDFLITPGMRIAQMVISAFCRIQWDFIAELTSCGLERDPSGFGSTGT